MNKLTILALSLTLSACTQLQEGSGKALGNAGSAIGSVGKKAWTTDQKPKEETTTEKTDTRRY